MPWGDRCEFVYCVATFAWQLKALCRVHSDTALNSSPINNPEQIPFGLLALYQLLRMATVRAGLLTETQHPLLPRPGLEDPGYDLASAQPLPPLVNLKIKTRTPLTDWQRVLPEDSASFFTSRQLGSIPVIRGMQESPSEDSSRGQSENHQGF